MGVSPPLTWIALPIARGSSSAAIATAATSARAFGTLLMDVRAILTRPVLSLSVSSARSIMVQSSLDLTICAAAALLLVVIFHLLAHRARR